MSKLYRSTFRYKGKKYERTSSVSQSEADSKAAALRKDLEDGNIGISKKMTVFRWSREWLEVYKKPLVQQKSFQQLEHYVDDVINPEIGSFRLEDVEQIHLQRILNSRKGNSQSDVKRLRDTIRGIFRRACESRLITYDVSQGLIMPSCKKGTNRSLTEKERLHFLKVSNTHEYGLMYKTMLYCGLRPGEIASLKWRDIDFESHSINVNTAMESGTTRIKEPKTLAGIRRVPIPDNIYHEFEILRGNQFQPVFPQKTTGGHHTKTSRQKAWNSFLGALDDSMGATWERVKAKDGKMRLKKTISVVAPDLVPYCLRHTYCTDLQQKGVSLKMASYLMGHASISVTANIYTHVTETAYNEAASLIGCTVV